MGFRNVGLIGKPSDPAVYRTLCTLAADLKSRNVGVFLDEHTAEGHEVIDLPRLDRDELGRTCDLALVIGGDGTLLHAARTLVKHDIAVLGINLGRLGFLVDVSTQSMQSHLDEILGGRFQTDHRFLLQAEVHRGDSVVASSLALNEVVVHKWDVARMIEFSAHIDGSFVYSVRADGLIIATPTGSTAYALSGGGPILHPALDAIVLVPICPHTLSNRPIVVDGGASISIHIHETTGSNAQVTCDGQVNLGLMAGDHVVIRQHPRALRLLHPADHDYYDILRAKLHWGRKLTPDYQ